MVETEQNLFNEWRKIHPNLVLDGMVNHEKYIQSNPRVLLILKEVNDLGGGNWDLRNFLLKGGRWQTWNTVTRWLIGIDNLNREVSWQEISKIDDKLRIEELQRLCVINLKKSPGGSSSEMDEIEQIALSDKKLLNQQFKLYKPNIIICGGTGNIVTEILEPVKLNNWKETKRGVSYNQIDNECYLFSYYHPQARIKESFLYYGILDAIREVYR